MNHPQSDDLSWNSLTWPDIQAIGVALAERHAPENILTLSPGRVAELVSRLPGFKGGDAAPDDFILSAILTAWITAQEGEDDSSPYEFLA